jgi:hypothetical protein
VRPRHESRGLGELGQVLMVAGIDDLTGTAHIGEQA